MVLLFKTLNLFLFAKYFLILVLLAPCVVLVVLVILLFAATCCFLVLLSFYSYSPHKDCGNRVNNFCGNSFLLLQLFGLFIAIASLSYELHANSFNQQGTTKHLEKNVTLGFHLSYALAQSRKVYLMQKSTR